MKFKIDLGIDTLYPEKQMLDLGYGKRDLSQFKKNENGLYIQDRKIIEANSLTANFIRELFAMTCVYGGTAIDTGNNSRTIIDGGSSGGTFRMDCYSVYTLGVTTGGIQLGTGTNATTISTYVIQTLIAHGTGSGQLSYGAVVLGGWSTTATTSVFNIRRTFTNNSGSNITNINEVTLVGRMNTTATQHFLVDRTVLPSAETINAGASKTFNYNFTVTV